MRSSRAARKFASSETSETSGSMPREVLAASLDRDREFANSPLESWREMVSNYRSRERAPPRRRGIGSRSPRLFRGGELPGSELYAKASERGERRGHEQDCRNKEQSRKVAGEVLDPSQTRFYFKVADPLLMAAIFRAHNDWFAEFCRTDPARLKRIAMINMDDVEGGIKELELAARLGLSGAMITPRTAQPDLPPGSGWRESNRDPRSPAH